ncbi:hypothetical protein EVAR_96344_1 [Eumeta japonica]|uniref:Uncharacterized protein n=1 Tax=Eumeta variegata TaxID=151549 RepID=A0A4C1VXL1_EUMVA|nr:hypothetical protein EVAR_96344_1 [Eumeta japonica]
MIKLEETMDPQTFENFKNGFFTVKRTEKFKSGTWTDMVIEQSLMKSMKTEGGVSRCRSTQDSVLCKWVYAMYATNTICEEMEKFCNISLDSTEHVDSRDSRVKRDNIDVNKLIEWFTLHNHFPSMTQMISLASGMVGNDQINCHKAYEIGLVSLTKITGLKFHDVKLKRSDKVLPLSINNKSVKVYDCQVSVDPLLLFQRITVSKKFERNLEEYLQYELSPYPIALFDSNALKKTTKASLYDNMTPTDTDLTENNVTFIIDCGFLLHCVVWSREDTFSIFFDKYAKYLQKHYGSDIVVVFDGHSDYSKNIKAMEQLRSTAALSKTYEICFDETMVVPVTQEKFLSNRNNKEKLINMLIEKLKAVDIKTKQVTNDADVLIIETAIEESKHGNTAVIMGEDIDLPVIVIVPTLSHREEIFFKKVGKRNVKTEIYSSKSFNKYPSLKKQFCFYTQKSRLQCSLACGQCNGQACLNASPYQSDINEDGTFDPEILEDLKTNVIEDENEKEFEIPQRPDDDDDEEEN